ncbi:MAG: flagellar basal body P-ring protein FlgI [Phycisphaerales bacterium]|jgi:flagellar P-ring protein precursor FlgI
MKLRAFTVIASLLTSTASFATTVKELVRIEGQGESVLRGVGLVVGLSGTGDSGKELAMARPLAKLLENNGNAVGSPLELKNGKSVALVSITCRVPADGALADDTLDVQVAVLNSATSLKGGQLYLAPLRGPFKDSDVYAIAEGLIDIQDENTPTVGKVRAGARLVQDIAMMPVGAEFKLIINAPYAGWASASQIASAINAKAQPQGPAVAVALDARTIKVTIPEAELADRAGFLADVLAADINNALLDLPAQVVVNQRTGAIIITGDVSISPVAITHKNLTITTITPSPVATAQNPVVKSKDWTEIKVGARPTEQARLTDLVAAFEQLDVPVNDQIEILQMLHKGGQLKAKLIID